MSAGWTAAYVVLAVCVALLLFCVVAIARYTAIIAARVGVPLALDTGQGPEVGSELSTVEQAVGRPVAIGGASHASLLVFMSTTCSACADLIPELALFARDYAGDLDVLAVVEGTESDVKSKLAALSPANYVADRGGNASRVLGIRGIPFALVYDGGRLTTKGVVNNRDMLANLVGGKVRALHSGVMMYEQDEDGSVRPLSLDPLP